MISVYCFSGSGHSKKIADYFCTKLNCEIKMISEVLTDRDLQCEIAVVVFPVYCQSIPKPVKRFLKQLTAKYLVLISTYGKISYGNVLYEAKKLSSGEVIAAAYIPMGHTFLKGNLDFDSNAVLPIFGRIEHPKTANVPRNFKNIFADFFPAWRSRLGVKIIKTSACNSCNSCGSHCSMNAIYKGNINSKCIRCLRCVSNCPQKALSFENRLPLKKYLEKHYKNEVRLYL